MSPMSASRGKEQAGRLENPFFAGLLFEVTAETQGAVIELLRESGVIVRVNVPRHGEGTQGGSEGGHVALRETVKPRGQTEGRGDQVGKSRKSR